MTKEEFFFYSIQERFLDNLSWYYEVFGVLIPSSNYKYVRIVDNKFVTGDDVIIEGDINKPLLDANMTLVIRKGMLSNVTEDIETTIGKVVVNYTLLCNNFGEKIVYDNGGK